MLLLIGRCFYLYGGVHQEIDDQQVSFPWNGSLRRIIPELDAKSPGLTETDFDEPRAYSDKL